MSRIKEMAWPSRMPEDEWAEVAQGLPAKDEPFLNKYLSSRDVLISQEKKQRSGEQDICIC
jgi:adenosine deaminase CECR1